MPRAHPLLLPPDVADALRPFSAKHVTLMRHSPAFELLLTENGRPVALVTNEGRGGAHRWWNPPGQNQPGAIRDALAVQHCLGEIVKRVTQEPHVGEAADHVVSCLADGAKDGADALRAWIRCMREYEPDYARPASAARAQ